jgi:alanyl-tRNA synthetase
VSTELLYHHDPLLDAFEGAVIAWGEWSGRPSVILDRTAFYPEAGGQMADRGVLAGCAVLDVQVDPEGQVHHLIDGPRPEIGGAVRGQIDRRRRRQFSALHTAQHALSRALIEVAGAETVSARLGESSCTIDLAVPALAEADAARAEALVSELIADDVAVRAWFPDREELASLPLRRPPKVEDRIRVVAIGEFDFSPCGGTHVARTAQIGLVRVLGVERYKGKIRVGFDAGSRARAALADESAALRSLAAGFTCGPLEVAAAIDKLRRELAAAKDLGRRLADRVADDLGRALAGAPVDRPLVEEVPGADPELLRRIAAPLTASGGRLIVLAAPGEEGTHLLIARGPDATADCGALLRRIAERAGGKGGGRADHAQGRLPAGSDWRQAVGAEVSWTTR